MRLLRTLGAVLLGLLLSVGMAGAAGAAPAPQIVAMNTCNLNAGGGANCNTSTGQGGRPPEAQFDPTNWGGGCSLLSGVRVPCIDDAGWAWNYAYQCYRRDVSADYPKEDPIWMGQTEGLILDCRRIDETEHETFWVFDLVGGINPAVLARQLISELELPPPGVTMSFDPNQTTFRHSAIIGMPMWMWVLDPSTVEDRQDARSADGLEVSIEAVADRIEWTMGDGAVVVCPMDAPGFSPEMAGRESPSCGHTYTQTSAGQPDDRYEVVARVFYNVTWTAGTMSGEDEIAPFATFQLPVAEFQTFVR